MEKQCTSLQGMTNAHGKDLDTDFFGQRWLRLIFSANGVGAHLWFPNPHLQVTHLSGWWWRNQRAKR